ncbi:hypothetical protein Tco_1444248, partial [Tanacetum coccineum]
GELDVSKASSKHISVSMFPTMAGSPTLRVPPAVETNNNHSDRLNSESSVSGHDFGSNHSYVVPSSSECAKKTNALSLGLVALSEQTGDKVIFSKLVNGSEIEMRKTSMS